MSLISLWRSVRQVFCSHRSFCAFGGNSPWGRTTCEDCGRSVPWSDHSGSTLSLDPGPVPAMKYLRVVPRDGKFELQRISDGYWLVRDFPPRAHSPRTYSWQVERPPHDPRRWDYRLLFPDAELAIRFGAQIGDAP